jgi:hypothetical protein
MKLNFSYEKKEDIWVLLNKGKSSNNSPTPTKVYEQLVEFSGGNPDESSTSNFIDKYIHENNINVSTLIKIYQKEFDTISSEFQKIAERVFGVSLEKNITVYLTINNRCPYNIPKNLFFVSMSNNSALRTTMHELWHFYTWYKFGADEQKRVGVEKYNDIKEALTVLLNIECKDLLPEGVRDFGYPQHQELRNEILKLWEQNPDIDFIWKKLTT